MQRIVLIGAGSTIFGLGVVGDIFKSKSLDGSTIVLHDINPKALDNTYKIAKKYKENDFSSSPKDMKKCRSLLAMPSDESFKEHV